MTVCLGECALDTTRSGITVSPREPEQGESRLRVPPLGAGVPVAPFCLVELTAQPVQLALLVDRCAEGWLDHR